MRLAESKYNREAPQHMRRGTDVNRRGTRGKPTGAKQQAPGGYARPVLARSPPAQLPARSFASAPHHCAKRSNGLRNVYVRKTAKQHGEHRSTSVAPCRWRSANLRFTSPHPARICTPVAAAFTQVPLLAATFQKSKAIHCTVASAASITVGRGSVQGHAPVWYHADQRPFPRRGGHTRVRQFAPPPPPPLPRVPAAATATTSAVVRAQRSRCSRTRPSVSGVRTRPCRRVRTSW